MADTNLIYPYTFEGGKKAVASEVNANFDAVRMFANGINATLSDIQTAIADLQKKPTREMFDIYFSITGETPVGAYPLWTGETITNCKVLYPQFWKKLLQLIKDGNVPTVESDTAYNEKVEEYGQCPAFYVDELNGHVRLPKITQYIRSITGLGDLGKALKAQISEHRHFIANGDKGGSTYTNISKNNHLAEEGGASATQAISYRLNGTNSEAIRGLTSGITSSDVEVGDTVRPDSVQLALYIQVANNFADIAELNTDVIAEQLSDAVNTLDTSYNEYSAKLRADYVALSSDVNDAVITINSLGSLADSINGEVI